MTKLPVTILCAAALVMPLSTMAQGTGTPTPEVLAKAYTGKVYSPYAQRGFPEQPLWGDTHVHTALSMDAGMFGNRLGPAEAYRLARGEEVIASSGQPVRLSRPLDWLVITDHSDGMGLSVDIIKGSQSVTKYKQGKRWAGQVAKGGQTAVDTMIQTGRRGSGHNRLGCRSHVRHVTR